MIVAMDDGWINVSVINGDGSGSGLLAVALPVDVSWSISRTTVY